MGDNIIFYIIGAIIAIMLLHKAGVTQAVISQLVGAGAGFISFLYNWGSLLIVYFVRSHASFLKNLLSRRTDILIKEKIEETNKNGGK